MAVVSANIVTAIGWQTAHAFHSPLDRGYGGGGDSAFVSYAAPKPSTKKVRECLRAVSLSCCTHTHGCGLLCQQKYRKINTTFGNAKAAALAARVDAPDLVTRMQRGKAPQPKRTQHHLAPQYGEMMTKADMHRLDITKPATHPAERANLKRELLKSGAQPVRTYSGHWVAKRTSGGSPARASKLAAAGVLYSGGPFRTGRAAPPGFGDRPDVYPSYDVGATPVAEHDSDGDSDTGDGSSSYPSSLGATTDVIDLLRKGWSATHNRSILSPSAPR